MFFISFIIYVAVIVIGFETDTYVVNESDGRLTVFVQIIQGELKRPAHVEISLSNGHANGETNNIYESKMHA